MHVRLEAEQAQQLEGMPHAFHVGGSAVQGEDGGVQALDAHLHLGAAEAAQQRQAFRRDGVRARFHHQADAAVPCLLVGRLLRGHLFQHGALPRGHGLPRRVLLVQLAHGAVVRQRAVAHLLLRGRHVCGGVFGAVGDAVRPVERAAFLGGAARFVAVPVVQGAEQLVHEPGLVVLRVVAPRAAQHDELNLVGDVAHLDQGVQAGGHLQIRVEPVAFGPLAGRLVCQIAFRHAQVVGAVQAVARTGPRLREHRDGGHAGRGAPRLHAQGLHEPPLQRLVDVPAAPAGRVGLLDVQVVGEEPLLGEGLLAGGPPFVAPADDLRQPVRVERRVGQRVGRGRPSGVGRVRIPLARIGFACAR